MIGQTVGDLLEEKVTLDIEGIDRMYLNMYQPMLQTAGMPFPWLSRGTVLCNHYYFYLVDEDFGPLFIKFASYFPYTARVCINGHEYAKRQLAKEGIAFEALDNGVLCCADPMRLQQILDELDAAKIQALVNKWLRCLPDPFTGEDYAAGFHPQLSILQAEFSRTQVFDRPLSGRHFFEEVIRENIDLGRPSKLSLIFQRRISKRTPGAFNTRVIVPKGSSPRCMSATNPPRSSSTSKKSVPCAPRRRSTTPVTSALDGS